MNSYVIELESRCSECGRLHDFLDLMAEREGFSTAFRHELRLVIGEAFVNAVRHGNREAAALPVLVELRMERNNGSCMLHADVSDRGRGFCLQSLPDPRSPKRLMQSSGRGLLFIREFAEITGVRRYLHGSTFSFRMQPY
ncbi:ATP-binding protein [Prosthecochloris sp. N3]|uniref:ATP-binding protein n=1 Tax=Prosthecochloris ethylica TaxID=2743976 RepID=A0ABR9XSK9_9CHLB|nr:ATP-binding protein [Prosthecochloris ethylica]MBF0585366.1 ATP-binding protein [Prosthecochloris ethylica]MBF0636902.1 ATP-binding protein [Prosthecochloris ethylica]MEC9487058.1 ATP-binding protein [Prosthecochloris sp.]NUK46595.1 ATP-binding protein [Prosthecochloris ethylica]